LSLSGGEALSGGQVAEKYGLLAHYATSDALRRYLEGDAIGGGYGGCWLTPTIYAACMAPYTLGLAAPKDVCLLVDVTDVAELWSPGTAPPAPPGAGRPTGQCTLAA